MVSLDILSDPICPWCYIGKAQLDRALERAADHPFAIEWHPFLLDPGMPAGGVPRRDYLVARLGGAAALAAADADLAQRARAAGVQIVIGDDQRIPNTLDAHRLIHWAGIEGRQTPMVSALFQAHFVQGRDIGDRRTLCEIAAGLGMAAEVVARLLASDAEIDAIRARDAHARRMGVTAVPTFIVGQRHAVTGAQPSALWDQVITEIAAQDGDAP